MLVTEESKFVSHQAHNLFYCFSSNSNSRYGFAGKVLSSDTRDKRSAVFNIK